MLGQCLLMTINNTFKDIYNGNKLYPNVVVLNPHVLSEKYLLHIVPCLNEIEYRELLFNAILIYCNDLSFLVYIIRITCKHLYDYVILSNKCFSCLE